MNKHGFTLIEILVSITLMALIATAASVNLINVLNAKNKTNEGNKDKIITTAACLYIELAKNEELKEQCLTTGCSISTTTLINEGLLNDEDVDKTKVINISKENNTKICKIN